MPISNLHKPKDVAELLSVSRSLVYTLLRDGDLEGVRVSKRSLRITDESLQRYLKERALRSA